MNTRDMNALLRKVYLAGVRYGVGDTFGTVQLEAALEGRPNRTGSEMPFWIAGAEARARKNFLPTVGNPDDLMDAVVCAASEKMLAKEMTQP